MAKFSVIFLVALIFQVTFAVVVRHQGTELNNYYNQLHAVVKDLSECLQTSFPNNKEVTKSITWESRRLAKAVQHVMNQLNKNIQNYKDLDSVFQNVISELQEIYTSLQQIVLYSDTTNASELKEQFIIKLQSTFGQIEKLVKYTSANFTDNEYSPYMTTKNILVDFIMTVQEIYTKIGNFKENAPITHLHKNSKQTIMQIREITNEIVEYLHREYFNDTKVEGALYGYAKYIQTLTQNLQEDKTVEDKDIDVIMHLLTHKLRQAYVYIYKINTNAIVDIKQWRFQVIRYFQEIAAVFEQLIQIVKFDSDQTQVERFVEHVINEYCHVIRQAYEEFRTSSEDFYRKNSQKTFDYPAALYKQFEKYRAYNSIVYGQTGYEHSKLARQMQEIVSDLSNYLETVYLDNEYVKQSFFNVVHEYIQNIQTIANKIEEATHTNRTTVHVQDLKQHVTTLSQLFRSDVIFKNVELKREFLVCVEKIAQEMEKCTMYMQENKYIKMAFFKYFTITRNMLMKLYALSGVATHAQAAEDFEIPIHTLASRLADSLRSVTFNNKQTKEVFIQQYSEFAINLKTIVVEKLEELTFKAEYNNEVFQEVLVNLKQIIASLEGFSNFEDAAVVEKMRIHFIVSVQDTATAIQKLLLVAQRYNQQDEFVNIFYGIINDFVGILQNQHIELQNIYLSKQYEHGAHEMAMQIQATTYNVALFLQNLPFNSILVRQRLEVQACLLAARVAQIVDKLAITDTYTNEQDDAAIYHIANNLKQTTIKFKELNQSNTYNSVYNLARDFHFLLQNVSLEMKNLAWFIERRMETVGYKNAAIKSVLIEYMVVIQNVQIEVQRMNQLVQIGETPKELALQLAAVARRVTELLRVTVPNDQVTRDSSIWQARRFYQIIDVITTRLSNKLSAGDDKMHYLVQQVAHNMETICTHMEQMFKNITIMNPYVFKMQFLSSVRYSSLEVQKLMWVAHSDIQQSQGIDTAFVRGIFLDYLIGVQNLHIQLQNNFQLFFTNQNPKTLIIRIQTIAKRLTTLLQYVHPKRAQFRVTLVIQIGEFTQTIENMIRLLQTDVKYNSGKNVMVKEICGKFAQISLYFQQLAEVKATDINEVSNKLSLNIQRVVYEIQKLGRIVEYQFEQTSVAAQTRTINAVFNNLFACLQNMDMQVRINYQLGGYEHTTVELASHIQTVNNNILHNIQTISSNTKQVKQAITIQAIKYARHLLYIVERLEIEVTYDNTMNVQSLHEIKDNLRRTIVAIHQMVVSLTTLTAVDLQIQFNSHIQNVAAQMQNLMLIQTVAPNNEICAVKSILLEYYTTIQNLHIQLQNIARMSHEGGNLQLIVTEIEISVFEITNTLPQLFELYRPTRRVVEETIVMEAHELAKMVTNIVSRFQSVAVLEHSIAFQQITSELKEFQLFLQQFSDNEMAYNLQQKNLELVAHLQRASIAIGNLIWVIPTEQQHMQFKLDIPTFARESLYDFLTSVQNLYIQIQDAAHMKTVNWDVQDNQIAYPLHKYLGSYQNSKQYMTQIQTVLDELYMVLQHSSLNSQQAKQYVYMNVHRMVQYLDSVIYKLQEQMSKGYKVDAMVKQIIDKLKDIQVYFKKITTYANDSRYNQPKMEFYNYIQLVVEQLEKLDYISQEMPESNLMYVIKNILKDFCYCLYDMREHFGQMQQDGYEFNQLFEKHDNGEKYNHGIDKLYNKYGKTYKYNDDDPHQYQYGHDKIFKNYNNINKDYQTAMNQYGYIQLKHGKTYKYNIDN